MVLENVLLVPERVFRRRLAGAADGLQPGRPDVVLRELAAYGRVNALAAVTAARHGWIGASFSVAEILTVLYFDVLTAPDRGRVILSKGHAAAMQYGLLAGAGFFPVEDLLRYKQSDGPQAHTDISTPGIAVNSGSLGQGLSKACGFAMASDAPVYVTLGDGELQEGQNFEALQTVAAFDLRHLVTIIDRNGIQSDSSVADIKAVEDLEQILTGFGFDVRTVDGHSIPALRETLRAAGTGARPSVVIADTKKGAGVSFMAADSCARRGYAWHGGVPDPRQYRDALRELGSAVTDRELKREIEELTASPSGREHHRAAPRPAGLSTGDAFSAALVRLAPEHAGLRVLDADLEKPCRLTEFAVRFPDQFIEMGIAEQDMVSCAGGLALSGLVPVVNTYASFFRRAFEQVYVNATEATRVLYAGHYAGLCYTTDGKTHQCTGDIAMMRSIPGMRVLYPAFAEELEGMLRWCLAGEPGPVYIRLHRTPSLVPVAPDTAACFQPDSGLHVRDRGARRAVVTSGPQLTAFAALAADRLREAGTRIDVFSVAAYHALAPDFCARLAGYEELFVVEETMGSGGLRDLVTAQLMQHRQSLPGIRHRSVDSMTFSTRDPLGLYRHFALDVESLLRFLNPGRGAAS